MEGLENHLFEGHSQNDKNSKALLRDKLLKEEERACVLTSSTKFHHVASSPSRAPTPHWHYGLERS